MITITNPGGLVIIVTLTKHENKRINNNKSKAIETGIILSIVDIKMFLCNRQQVKFMRDSVVNLSDVPKS